MIAVVGAIDERGAADLVDRAFADLPAKGDLKAVGDAEFAGLGSIDAIDLDVPQSTIRFGRPALKRDDPDYIASVVAAHVLGGSGSMTSRLFREVREKRGLAYTVFGTFYALEHGTYFYGGTTTKNERARESFDVAAAEIRDVALNGLGEEELEKGKTYLIGSYPLRFDTSAKIASQLVHIQLEGRAPDWLIERNREIAAVTQGERAPRRPPRVRRRRAAYDGGGEAGGVLSSLSPAEVKRAATGASEGRSSCRRTVMARRIRGITDQIRLTPLNC